jgi:hypothetical protein
VYFIEGIRNNKQYLFVLNKERTDGVLISEVPFMGKLLPILFRGSKITELSPEWGPIRKALLGDDRFIDFKDWLYSEARNDSAHSLDATLDVKEEGLTLVIEKGTLLLKDFKEIFFTDETHMSTSLYRRGDIETIREFPTARGSKWLARALLQGGFQAFGEESEDKSNSQDPDYMSFEEIFGIDS